MIKTSKIETPSSATTYIQMLIYIVCAEVTRIITRHYQLHTVKKVAKVRHKRLRFCSHAAGKTQQIVPHFYNLFPNVNCLFIWHFLLIHFTRLINAMHIIPKKCPRSNIKCAFLIWSLYSFHSSLPFPTLFTFTAITIARIKWW